MSDDLLDRLRPIMARLDRRLEQRAASGHHGCVCGEAGFDNAIASAKDRIVEEVRAALDGPQESAGPSDGHTVADARTLGNCGERLGVMRCQLRRGHDGDHEDFSGLIQEKRA
jgi:hypothetical protein